MLYGVETDDKKCLPMVCNHLRNDNNKKYYQPIIVSSVFNSTDLIYFIIFSTL